MATVKQIYSFVNDVRKEAFGEKTVDVLNTSDLVSLGDYVFSSDTNKDMFWGVLLDKIGRTECAIRQYKGKGRSVKKDPIEYGCMVEKISYTIGDASQNDSWVSSNDSDPCNISGCITPTSKLFKAVSTWERDQFIPDRQLKMSFKDATSMGAFISGLFIALDNALSLEEDRVCAMAVNTYIACALNSNNANVKRNLLKEYNTLTGETLTVEKCLTDKEFLRFASKEINQTIDFMKEYSVLFNADKKQRFTDKGKMVVEMLAEFSNSFDSYLSADTFHNELVKLPNYEKVGYWQGSGNSFDFADTSKINITIGEDTVEKSGIICFVHDIDAVGECAYDIRTKSFYNPRNERTNYFKKADIGFMVDTSENGVVFYVEDEA